jgi:CheY-like chemotaxis protein
VGHKPKILLVDDDEECVDRVRQTVEGAYEVVALTDWNELNEHVLEGSCALVLVDLDLPLVSGDLLVALLKDATPETTRPKLVYFSNADEDTLARVARETEADGYISKRAVGSALLSALGSYVGQ